MVTSALGYIIDEFKPRQGGRMDVMSEACDCYNGLDLREVFGCHVFNDSAKHIRHYIKQSRKGRGWKWRLLRSSPTQ